MSDTWDSAKTFGAIWKMANDIVGAVTKRHVELGTITQEQADAIMADMAQDMT